MFVRSHRSLHLLSLQCSAAVCSLRYARSLALHGIAHSLRSLPCRAVEIHKCVHAVIAFNRKKHVFGCHRKYTFFGKLGVVWGLILRFSVVNYEVQDGAKKIVTKITCARALVRRISANDKFT